LLKIEKNILFLWYNNYKLIKIHFVSSWICDL